MKGVHVVKGVNEVKEVKEVNEVQGGELRSYWMVNSQIIILNSQLFGKARV